MSFSRSQSIFIRKAPEFCFDFCKKVDLWQLFMPAVRKGVIISKDAESEVIELEVEVGRSLDVWRSRRWVNSAELLIRFERIDPQFPFMSIGGRWLFNKVDGGCRITLEHFYTLFNNQDREQVESIISFNVTRDLEGMKTYIEGA